MFELEWQWLDSGTALDLTELSHVCELSSADLMELIDYGALSPLDATAPELRFSAQCLTSLRTASRLRRDFDLDLFASAILMEYLQRIETLENEVQALRAK
jgi:chaperone modulatory protein CbpM